MALAARDDRFRDATAEGVVGHVQLCGADDGDLHAIVEIPLIGLTIAIGCKVAFRVMGEIRRANSSELMHRIMGAGLLSTFLGERVPIAGGGEFPGLVFIVIDAAPGGEPVLVVVGRRVEAVIGHWRTQRFGKLVLVVVVSIGERGHVVRRDRRY